MKKKMFLTTAAASLLALMATTPAFADPTSSSSSSSSVNNGAASIKVGPTSENTPVVAQFTYNANGGTPQKPEDQQHNKTDDTTGNELGICYQPVEFYFSGQLNDSGQQTFTSTPGSAPNQADDVPGASAPTTKLYEVGVKDTTRDNTQWMLSATFNWNPGDNIPGSTLTLTSPQAEKNINNGTLTGTNEVSLAGSPLVITAGGSTEDLMKDSNEQHNATFDLNFPNVVLTIPDVTNVQARTYNGNVNWNLAVTAQGTPSSSSTSSSPASTSSSSSSVNSSSVQG